jgi:hypothetical protein
VPHLDRIVADPNPKSEWLTALSHLERGRIHDIEGRRDLATADYRRVLELKDFRGSRDNAKGYLNAPYTVPPEEASHYLPAMTPRGSVNTAQDPYSSGQSVTPPGSATGKRP